MVNKIYNC